MKEFATVKKRFIVVDAKGDFESLTREAFIEYCNEDYNIPEGFDFNEAKKALENS